MLATVKRTCVIVALAFVGLYFVGLVNMGYRISQEKRTVWYSDHESLGDRLVRQRIYRNIVPIIAAKIAADEKDVDVEDCRSRAQSHCEFYYDRIAVPELKYLAYTKYGYLD